MELQGLNVGLEAIKIIIDTLTNLQQCGGVATNDSLWAFASGFIPTEVSTNHLQSLDELGGTMQRTIAGLKRVEAVKETLYELARSCERNFQALKLKTQPLSLHCGIQMLPDDILADIFQLVVDDHYSISMVVDEHDSIATIPPELTISRVCTRFRSLALSVPSLWTRMTSRMTGPAVCHYLEWSKNAPMTVVISESRWSERLHEFIQLVTGHVSRWKAFEFEAVFVYESVVPHDLPTNLERYLVELQLPKLEVFSFQFRHPNIRGDFEYDEFNFYRSWSMPKLRDATFSQVLPTALSSPFSPQTIRSFTFSCCNTNCDMQDLVDLLVAMPNLSDLNLDMFFNEYAAWPELVRSEFDQDVLPNITALNIKTNCSDVISTAMDRLRLPSLNKLRLSVTAHTDDLSMNECLDAIPSEVYVSVKELYFSFSSRWGGRLSLGELFGNFPGLERLDLDVPSYCGSFMPKTPDGNLPPLRSLSIQFMPMDDLRFLESFIRALKSTGDWERFEFFRFKGDKYLTKQQAEVLTEGKVKWFE